jgi:hypothetical protein
MLRFLLLSCCFLAIAPLSAEPKLAPAQVPLQKIFDDGRYNSFTDLARFDGAYYCTFRSAISHGDPGSGVVGNIVVIRSEDLTTWQEVARFTLQGVDLRDPKLTATPHGIRLYAVAGEISEAGILQYRTAAWSSADGRHWSGPVQMTPGYIFWRPKWHAGKFYVPAYLRRPGYCSVDLLVSENGDDWRLHSTPLPPTDVEAESLWANECDLLFLPEGKALLFSRRNHGDGPQNPKNEHLGGFRRGYVGLAETPSLSAWRSVNEDLYFHAPAALAHRGKIYLAARDMVKLPNGATETCRLWELDLNGGFTELAHFKTHGDCSYPGIVPIDDNELAVSYYSCHEGTTAYFDKPGKSDIYLARIPLSE